MIISWLTGIYYFFSPLIVLVNEAWSGKFKNEFESDHWRLSIKRCKEISKHMKFFSIYKCRIICFSLLFMEESVDNLQMLFLILPLKGLCLNIVLIFLPIFNIKNSDECTRKLGAYLYKPEAPVTLNLNLGKSIKIIFFLTPKYMYILCWNKYW